MYRSTGSAALGFLILIQTILAAQCIITPPGMWPEDYGEIALEKGLGDYDFIIVGAGSAGSVVAGRLSENPEWKVLLVEAGGNPTLESEIPALMIATQKTEIDWQFYADSNSNSYCLVQNNKTCFWPRGKTLGGSSAINFMMYVRGNKADFDGWSEQGNSGWDYESVLPYFKKWEHNHDASFVAYKNGEYHSDDGPLNVDHFSEDGMNSIRQIFLDAAVESGNQQIIDINSDVGLGYLNIQGFYYDGTRQSAAKAFLIPAKNRTNLHIMKHSLVTKILIKNKQAYGVNLLYTGKETREFTATAQKEVIISAGGISSPQLLMLSGIGPEEHLKKFDIPIESDLAVGQNLMDHPLLASWFTFNPTITGVLSTLAGLPQYALNKTGRLASIGATTLTGFINTVNGTGVPDFQIFFIYFTVGQALELGLFLDKFNYNAEVSLALQAELLTHDVVGIAPVMLHEKSRGVIELLSTSPDDHPFIQPRYFQEAEDMEAMLRVLKLQISYLNTTAYKEKGGQFIDLPLPECDELGRGSDDYYRCYIRYFTNTCFHPAGTCKMGNSSDTTAVVDNELKVRGIENLRVIDASIMPNTVSGNINAATQMIGEKGADLIKKTHSESS